jgi:hypothetical protein
MPVEVEAVQAYKVGSKTFLDPQHAADYARDLNRNEQLRKIMNHAHGHGHTKQEHYAAIEILMEWLLMRGYISCTC